MYLTPTPEKYKAMRSRVAPLPDEAASSAPVCAKPANRGPLETRAQVEAALDACRKRSPRLPLATESQARGIVPADWSGPTRSPSGSACWPTSPRGAGPGSPRRFIPRPRAPRPRLKAEIAYIAARNDRAWYALGHARQRLKGLGMNDAAIDALDHPDDTFPEAERLALALARKLTVNPALITDEDIAGLRGTIPDPEVAEILFHVDAGARSSTA